MTSDEFEKTFKKESLRKKYFLILKDKEWHCRECAQKQIGSRQIAGGGGTQGLQRGTKNTTGVSHRE